MPTFTVHLFARIRELAGAPAVSVELAPGSTVADLRARLTERLPAAAGLIAVSAIAVNHDFADDGHVLNAGDEVAVIPPVSGG